MKRMLVCLAVGAMVAAFAAPVFAGTLDLARVGLHIQGHNTKNWCTTNAPSTFGCDAVAETSTMNTVAAVGVSYDMYIVVVDIPVAAGLQGIEFGISYDPVGASGLDAFGVVSCASLEVPGLGWPNAGGVATYTWTTCQGTVDAGDPQGEMYQICASIYAYAYGPDTACIEKKASGVLGGTDCAATSSDLVPHFPLNAGCVDFGGGTGSHPCVQLVTPVEETTWGAIKSQFEGE